MGGGDSEDVDFDEEDTLAENDPANRREQARIEATLKVEYRSLDEFVVAYTTDISHGGLFLQADSFLPAGSIVQLELKLPDEGPTVRIIARVAYLLDGDERKGMGMEFLDVEGGPIADQLAGYLTLTMGVGAIPDKDPPAQVLVVDDDRGYRDQAVMVMKKRGHRVDTAENGLEALGKVLRQAPDLILSDVQMPTMDGWQFLRLLRARPSVAHIPVIFLTTLSSEDERLKGYQLGVDDYIPKPFLFEELSVRVSRVLARSRGRSGGAAAKNALRGDLSQVSLASVLQFVELERRTGMLLVISSDQISTLHIRQGRVVSVAPTGDDETPLERLYRVLDWSDGRFELTTAEVDAEDVIDRAISFVLLEHARRSDEHGRE